MGPKCSSKHQYRFRPGVYLGPQWDLTDGEERVAVPSPKNHTHTASALRDLLFGRSSLLTKLQRIFENQTL